MRKGKLPSRAALFIGILAFISAPVASSAPIAAEAQPSPPSVKTDPRYKVSLIAALGGDRIYGKLGRAADPPGPSTVAVTGHGLSCSGVLIAPTVVLTALHCYCDGAAEQVMFGVDSASPKAVLKVQRVVPRVACHTPLPGNDLALLFLEGPGRSPPVTVLFDADHAEFTALRAIGYGLTETGDSGVALYTDIPVVSATCNGQVQREPDAQHYECMRDSELVAGIWKSNIDTCNGDSGGPMFKKASDGRYLLAAITSRAIRTPGARSCGDGGIYELVTSQAVAWIRSQGVQLNLAT